MNKKPTYEIINIIVSLMNSEDFDSSITSIADKCNIPIEYTRKCILRLLNNNILSSCIDTNDYINNDDPESSFIEDFNFDNENISKQILSGMYDNYNWTINLRVLDLEEDQLLPLDSLEYNALLNISESKSSFKRSAIYEKKDNITKVSKIIRTNQETIRIAVEKKHAITFTYKDSKGIISNPVCFPTEIFTNVSDNWIYFNTTDGYPYRLDRIISNVKELKDYGPFPKVIDNPYKQNIWGAFSSKDDIPIHVKIVISDTGANLIRKIKNDIKHREPIGHLYKKDGLYFYEDDIIGLPEFQRWIRGYGSSIQVIEPLDLQEKMIESAKTALSNYERADEWKDL